MFLQFTFSIIVSVFLIRDAYAYIEYVEVSNCASCQLMLTCRHLNSVIAVFNASFEPFDDNSTYYMDFKKFLPPIFPRLALNRRCSGVNHCSFILTEDSPGAENWGPGNFTVRFACISERKITRYCNENVTLPSPEVIGVSEGFVRNPGYPNYYLGKQECKWRITAPSMQKIKLTILDLSLISKTDGCVDYFEVKELENTIFASCYEQEPYKEIVSLGDTFEITLKASESLVARRGILFHYTALGCPTPPSPADGYLVFRNDTYAVYTCTVGYAFPDTLQRETHLNCLGHHWDRALPLLDCIEYSTSEEFYTKDGKRFKMPESLSDVVLPSIIIITLFVINTIIVLFIYRYKKRLMTTYTEEELGTMPIDQSYDYDLTK